MVWKLILVSDGSSVTWSNTSSFNCIWKGTGPTYPVLGPLAAAANEEAPTVLGPTNRAFSNSKPLQQAHVGGMKSVLVGVLKRWKMASATVLGFFFQRAILAGTSLALMSQMGIVLKEGSRETRAVSVVGNSTQGPSSGARAEDAWRTADSTPVLWVEGASGSQGRNCRTTWTGPERLAAGSTQFGVEETASRI